MHIISDAYITCYILRCEAKKANSPCATASVEKTSGLLARSQRLLSPGVETLHPSQLPRLRQRQEASQPPVSLHPKRPTSLPLRACGDGANAEAGLGQRPPR